MFRFVHEGVGALAPTQGRIRKGPLGPEVISLQPAQIRLTPGHIEASEPTMKAIEITEYGPPDVIHVADILLAEPSTGQLRVRVRAAGVAPWDALIREGRSGIPQKLPLILGSDIAGTV